MFFFAFPVLFFFLLFPSMFFFFYLLFVCLSVSVAFMLALLYPKLHIHKFVLELFFFFFFFIYYRSQNKKKKLISSIRISHSRNPYFLFSFSFLSPQKKKKKNHISLSACIITLF